MQAPTKGRKVPYNKTVRKCTAEVEVALPGYKEQGITTKQARFAAEFLSNGLNGAEAYKAAIARPSEGLRACQTGAAAMLRLPGVQAALTLHSKLWLRERQEHLENDILKVLNARAFFDPGIIINVDGTPRFEKWEDLPEEFRRCIDGIETRTTGATRTSGPITTTIVKLANRMESLQMLSQYIHLSKGNVANVNLAITPETQALLTAVFQGNAPTLAGQPNPRVLANARRQGVKNTSTGRTTAADGADA